MHGEFALNCFPSGPSWGLPASQSPPAGAPRPACGQVLSMIQQLSPQQRGKLVAKLTAWHPGGAGGRGASRIAGCCELSRPQHGFPSPEPVAWFLVKPPVHGFPALHGARPTCMVKLI